MNKMYRITTVNGDKLAKELRWAGYPTTNSVARSELKRIKQIVKENGEDNIQVKLIFRITNTGNGDMAETIIETEGGNDE